MANQLLNKTEEWLFSELQVPLQSDASSIWESAEQTVIEETHDVQRWFDYLREKEVIPQHFRMEAFTIPRLDSFEGDDMLVVYQENTIWAGYPLSRFTAFTKYWNKKGVLDFLESLFPTLFIVEPNEKESSTDGGSHFPDIAGWSFINGNDVEVDREKTEDLFSADEEGIQLESEELYGIDEEGGEVQFESEHTEFGELDLEEGESMEDAVDIERVTQLLEGIHSNLNNSLTTVEECVQEAIDLASQKKGSKRLVRLTLEIEEELIALRDQLSIASKIDED